MVSNVREPAGYWEGLFAGQFIGGVGSVIAGKIGDCVASITGITPSITAPACISLGMVAAVKVIGNSFLGNPALTQGINLGVCYAVNLVSAGKGAKLGTQDYLVTSDDQEGSFSAGFFKGGAAAAVAYFAAGPVAGIFAASFVAYNVAKRSLDSRRIGPLEPVDDLDLDDDEALLA